MSSLLLTGMSQAHGPQTQLCQNLSTSLCNRHAWLSPDTEEEALSATTATRGMTVDRRFLTRRTDMVSDHRHNNMHQSQ